MLALSSASSVFLVHVVVDKCPVKTGIHQMVIVALVDKVYLTVDDAILLEKKAARVTEGCRELCAIRSRYSL